jgi:amino acid transporter
VRIGTFLPGRTAHYTGVLEPHFWSRTATRPHISGTATFILIRTDSKTMKKQFILGLVGGFLGILTAVYVILSAVSTDQTLSGVQTALFSSLGLMGAVIANKETRFAGWMLIFAAVFITLSVPIAGSLNLLFLYMPAVIIIGIAGVLCFMEPEEEKPAPE